MKTNKIMILIAGVAIQLSLGIIYIWSVFKAPIMKYYQWESNEAALVSSIMLVSFVAGIIFGGRIQDKTNPTVVVLGGGILLSLGLFLSSILPESNPELLYLTYGVISGFGVGGAYNAIISCAQRWYPERKGFATGVAVCAFGFSTVIFAPVARKMLETMEVHSIFRIFALVFLIIILVFFSFIQNPKSANNQKQDLPGVEPLQALKSPNYYLIACSMALLTMLFFFINPLLIDLAGAKGISADIAVIGVMVCGIANASGRLIAPVLSDKIGYKKTIISLLVITMVGGISLIFVQGIAFFAIVFLIAMAYGGSSGVFPIATVSNFGPKNMGTIYGFVMIGFAVSALATPYIGKALQRGTDLTLYFIVTAIGCAVAILLTSMIKKKAD